MDPLEFNNTVQTYDNDGYTESDCGDITFQNKGTAPVTINYGVELLSNQSITFGANVGEINRTKFNIVFNKDPAFTKSLLVIKKYYINQKY